MLRHLIQTKRSGSFLRVHFHRPRDCSGHFHSSQSTRSLTSSTPLTTSPTFSAWAETRGFSLLCQDQSPLLFYTFHHSSLWTATTESTMAHREGCACCNAMAGSPKVKVLPTGPLLGLRIANNYQDALHHLHILQSDAANLQIREYIPSPTKPNTTRTERKTAKTSKTTVKRRSKASFPFLDLPAEIRNIIYGYCLVDNQYAVSIGIEREKVRRRLVKRGDFISQHGEAALEVVKSSTAHIKGVLRWRLNNQFCVQLLRVNKQIHDEAITILYAQNLFSFLDPTSMLFFFNKIGSNIRDIRRISLLFWDNRDAVVNKNRAFIKLVEAVNLESLALEGGCLYSMTRYSNSYPDALHFYQTAQPWLWAVAGRTGCKETPLRILHLFGETGENIKLEGRQQARIKQLQQVQVFRQLSAHFVSACEPMYESAFLQTIRIQMA
ncbi:hypothetical protein K491DRAFT_451521 [Lophiostoma macrostomum CBS 122681]|uniref:DUF7730 domain-containing protein n=1 Tax=Lophiostoma macrostomum CBS 122681 TaxID=1314788 RepID=A0A6A6TQY6_9PLEO|nr:hypothetical protein K491DRAFT_451521 [Lophiostoma macrostomum CBS 122681]